MSIKLRAARGYIERFLKIRSKDNRIIPLKLNAPQEKLFSEISRISQKGIPVRILILKARQMGFSTLTEAIIFHRTVTRENVNSLIIAHKEEATTNLFNMAKLFYDNLPAILRPARRASNAKELIFESTAKSVSEKCKAPGLRSKIKCMSAGGDGVGRSDTFSNVHISEYAFWGGDKRATLSGLMQSVPHNAGTLVIIESTANGYDDFKNMWDRAVRGETDFVPLFFPWYALPEYSMKYDGFELTDAERAMGLTNEQIAWRRWCIANNCGGDERMFRQEYPATPEEAFLTSGDCIFDAETLAHRARAIPEKFRTGRFAYDYDGTQISNIHFEERDDGCVKIYSEPHSNEDYVIGGDTAGDGSDSFAGQVLSRKTACQVAVLHHTFDEDVYAQQMYCLGEYYNLALIGIESNFSTYPNKELARLGYRRIYVRVNEDNFTGSMSNSYGFRTTSVTRPLIIAELVRMVRDAPTTINDAATISEMMSFVRNKAGRAEAAVGSHDDLVIALGIAYYLRSAVYDDIPSDNSPRTVWEADMYDDYFAAGSELRAEMIKKWGRPSDL